MANKKIFFYIFSGLILANIFIWLVIFGQSGKSELDFFNVGQGDAALLRMPNTDSVLIDAGPDAKILNELNKVGFGMVDPKIFILSHANFDHYSGFEFLTEKYLPEIFAWNGEAGDAKFQKFLSLLKEKGVRLVVLKKGEKIFFNSGFLEVLGPNLIGPDSNGNSLVLRVVFQNGKSALFTGDAEIKNLEEIDLFRSDILKVSHHGSLNGTSKNILKSVQPDFSFISVGENNPYNHPSDKILKLLDDFGIKIFRTDRDGGIRFMFDDNGLKIKKI